MKDITKDVVGGRWVVRAKRREADKLRRKRDLCQHADDLRIFVDKVARDEALNGAEAQACALCGKKRLVVAVTLDEKASAVEQVYGLALTTAVGILDLKNVLK